MVKAQTCKGITLAIATHFHSDRTGGMDALRRHGVRVLAHPLTCKLASDRQLPVPDPIEAFGDAPYSLGDDCELFFPGGRHTRDNIVLWLPHQKVLCGGCFLNSTTSRDLGNLDDAVVADWAASVESMHTRYPAPKMTVPGHGTTAGDAVAHTLALLKPPK